MIIPLKITYKSVTVNWFPASHINMAVKWKNMDRELYMAVTTNNVEEFRRLIRHNANLLNQKTPRDHTVLHLAAKYGHQNIIKEICRCQECACHFTEKDLSGYTPLHIAAWYGHTEVAALLIDLAREAGNIDNQEGKSKADEMLEARTWLGHTALHWAVWNGHFSVVKELTQAYPNMVCMADIHNWSALYSASSKGHLQIVEHILSVDVERSASFYEGPDGECPLHVAISEGHLDVVETLLTHLPEYAKWTSNKGETPLQIAAERGMLSAVRKLLELHPSVVYQTGKCGNAPLHGAAHGGHLMVFKEIIRFCPDSWNITNERRQNVLHTAVLANQLNMVEYILKTPEFDQLINARDSDGHTPLHLAVVFDHIWIVFLLLDDRRLMVRATNKKGETAFEIITSKLEWGIPFSQKVEIWWAIKKAGKYRSVGKTDRYAWKTNISQPGTRKLWIATANTLLVVAALIATVSFAAIFTLPGGYENSGSEEGLANYRSRTMFRIFLFLDGFAMFSALVAALLVIVANWTDSLGLRSMVPWALKMTALSFISMSTAFSWATGVMVKYNWALVAICFLNFVIVCLVISFFGFDSPAYFFWRFYLVLRRVKKMVTRCMHHVWKVLKEYPVSADGQFSVWTKISKP